MTTTLFNLHNFFKYYKDDNAKHRAAVDELITNLDPDLLNDQANWVRIYRSAVKLAAVETMNDSNTISQPGLELIKKFEGCKLKAYPDPRTGRKPYTIGWGSTKKKDGNSWNLGEVITQEVADELLEWHIEKEFLPPLTKIPGWDEFNDNQRGALLSFAYNLGAYFYGNKDFATISRVLKDRNYSQIRKALLLYCNPGTNVTVGLRRRRSAEADLWEKGMAATESSQIMRVRTMSEAPSEGNIVTLAEVDWHDMSCRLTPNFTLGENLKNDPARIPTSVDVKQNIWKIMQELQKIRDDWQDAIIITSGHRPPKINQKFKGVPDSRHITGDAVDIAPANGKIWEFQKWLDANWYGGLGYGAKKGFVHIDLKNCADGQGWKIQGRQKGRRWPY